MVFPFFTKRKQSEGGHHSLIALTKQALDDLLEHTTIACAPRDCFGSVEDAFFHTGTLYANSPALQTLEARGFSLTRPHAYLRSDNTYRSASLGAEVLLALRRDLTPPEQTEALAQIVEDLANTVFATASQRTYASAKQFSENPSACTMQQLAQQYSSYTALFTEFSALLPDGAEAKQMLQRLQVHAHVAQGLQKQANRFIEATKEYFAENCTETAYHVAREEQEILYATMRDIFSGAHERASLEDVRETCNAYISDTVHEILTTELRNYEELITTAKTLGTYDDQEELRTAVRAVTQQEERIKALLKKAYPAESTQRLISGSAFQEYVTQYRTLHLDPEFNQLTAELSGPHHAFDDTVPTHNRRGTAFISPAELQRLVHEYYEDGPTVREGSTVPVIADPHAVIIPQKGLNTATWETVIRKPVSVYQPLA